MLLFREQTPVRPKTSVVVSCLPPGSHPWTKLPTSPALGVTESFHAPFGSILLRRSHQRARQIPSNLATTPPSPHRGFGSWSGDTFGPTTAAHIFSFQKRAPTSRAVTDSLESLRSRTPRWAVLPTAGPPASAYLPVDVGVVCLPVFGSVEPLTLRRLARPPDPSEPFLQTRPRTFSPPLPCGGWFLAPQSAFRHQTSRRTFTFPRSLDRFPDLDAFCCRALRTLG